MGEDGTDDDVTVQICSDRNAEVYSPYIPSLTKNNLFVSNFNISGVLHHARPEADFLRRLEQRWDRGVGGGEVRELRGEGVQRAEGDRGHAGKVRIGLARVRSLVLHTCLLLM